MPRTTPPRGILVLKDGHVGSEWFAETISKQPGVRFVFEMGACITSSVAAKNAFFGADRRACACGREECATFRGGTFSSAPCLDAPSRRACRLLGGSIMTVTDNEQRQWEAVLANRTDVLVVVQTRSNLVKWAWSFFRTGAMARLRKSGGQPTMIKQSIHRREKDNDASSSSTSPPPVQPRVHVDPNVLLRMIVAKQARSERLLRSARKLAKLTGQKRERVLLYEAMQRDMPGELSSLHRALGLQFDLDAHNRVPLGSSPLLKHATENLSNVISNWDALKTAFKPYPCLSEMLSDTSQRVFDDCGGGVTSSLPTQPANPSAPCACSWRTPILTNKGKRLDDAMLKARLAGVQVPTKATLSKPAEAVAFSVTWGQLDAVVSVFMLLAVLAGMRRWIL